MSRRIRLAVIVALTTFALGATACASVTGPSGDVCVSSQGSNTCQGS